MAERPGSRRSILGIFDCWSAGLYRLVSRSWLGRCLTGYRREPTALLSGETRARGMHAMSDRRCRVVRAAEGSRVLAVARRLVHLLADCPARLYGLFFLLYGIVCCLIRLLQPFLIAGRSLDLRGIVFSVFNRMKTINPPVTIVITTKTHVALLKSPHAIPVFL